MVKTQEELKKEYEALNKLKELTEKDLKNVLGGSNENNKQVICPVCKEPIGTTLEMIIQAKSLICPKCGLHLYID